MRSQANPLFDPATTAQDATGAWLRLPFAGSQIPTSRFDPAIRNFLSNNPYTPQNQNPALINYNGATGPANNLGSPTNYRSWRTRYDAKIDHQFAPNHRMFGRYSHVRHRSWRDRPSPEIAWAEFDWRAVKIPIDQRNVVLSDTCTFSPALINEARLGFNRRKGAISPVTIGQGWAAKLGIPGVSDENSPYFEACNNQSTCTGGSMFFRQSALSRTSEVGEDFTFQNNLTKIIKGHTVKFGYETIRTRFNSLVAATPSGTYRFGATDFPFRQNTGIGFTAFMPGSVSQAVFIQAMTTWLPQWWSHAFYVQDDFKIRRSITLNLGLRWSYETPFNTKWPAIAVHSTVADPISGRIGAITHPKNALAKRDLNNFQPRLGIAWQIKPNLVFRSSFGMITQDLSPTVSIETSKSISLRRAFSRIPAIQAPRSSSAAVPAMCGSTSIRMARCRS